MTMTNPSVLAFERKIDPSDGLFHVLRLQVYCRVGS